MSQHVFRTTSLNGDPVTVTLGYDRPLDYVFCLVQDPHGECLYSNLADPDAGTEQQSVDYFRPVLVGLGIAVPSQIFVEVESDQLNAVGNRWVDHTV